MITNIGLQVIVNLIKQVSNIYGDVVEVGVYKGGSAEVICENVVNKQIYLFDTFSGIPFSNEFDNFHKQGDFSDTSFTFVERKLSKYNNVKIFQGIFPEKNSDIISENKFSFVHLDIDVYESYMQCLTFFYKRMSIGGIILFDDYNSNSCLGAKKAVDTFFINKKENIIKTNYSNSVYIIKM